MADRITLRSFQEGDLDALVQLWNGAFAGRSNFQALTAEVYRRRVLECGAFDPRGLILAWRQTQGAGEELVGMVHAFKPAPRTDAYRNWDAHHAIALIYVQPEQRSQGVGSRLLQAAENWLYYCPVFVADRGQPCYGSVEGLWPPLFGSTQHMGVSARDTTLIRFLAKRGYRAVAAGDVSMTVDLYAHPPSSPVESDLGRMGLRAIAISERAPFTGREPRDRLAYTLRGDNHGQPYAGIILVDGDSLLQAHIGWYPLPAAGRVAIGGFWVAPELRGQGCGRYLLDRALAEIAHAAPPHGGHRTVEVLTHLTAHVRAVDLYQRRGFDVVDAWVTLVKT